MIPKIIHQIQITADIPERFARYMDGWDRHNPGWKRILWSERELLDFVAEHYPDFLPIYCNYPEAVMRTDAGRYLLLHHFGGIYVDIDCECLASFDRFAREDRIVMCREPEQHWREQGIWRGLPYILFSGTMASPAGHPFWMHLVERLRETPDATDVLDATGPCILTSAQLSFADPSAFALHPAALFTPVDKNGEPSSDHAESMSVHRWAGTWWTPKPPPRLRDHMRKAWYLARYHLTRGPQFDGAAALEQLKPLAKADVPPADGSICIFIPVRNGAQHMQPLSRLLRGLDHPAERIRLVFCEGDSTDDTWARLEEIAGPLDDHFAGVTLFRHPVGNAIGGPRRHRRPVQRQRRGSIAKVRNHMIAQGLSDRDDWVLWIDADICDVPPDIVSRLLAARERIVTPNCVKSSGGRSFDRNSFVERGLRKDHRYYRAVRKGVYQPDGRHFGRYHLSDLRHLDKVELDAVGGTMLLVDAALHRGGLTFPEEPYCDLIETEAFGKLASDIGVKPVGLPRVEIRHVPW